MKELLSKWAALEPGRCFMRGSLGRVLVGGASMVVYEECLRALGLAYVQAAVQEAIEARAWHWQTFYFPEATGDKHRAAVDGFNTPTYEPLKEFAAPSAAEALLSAYLTALEAQG